MGCVYWVKGSNDIGRRKISRLIVKSSRSGIEIERESRGTRLRTRAVYVSTDFGRARIGKFFVESGRLIAAMKDKLQDARKQMDGECTLRRTYCGAVPVGRGSTTLRDEARRWAGGAGHRPTSPRVPAGRFCLLLRPPEPEVMRTSTAEANAAAVPAAPVRKQERARRRPRQASERRASHEADGRCTNS